VTLSATLVGLALAEGALRLARPEYRQLWRWKLLQAWDLQQQRRHHCVWSRRPDGRPQRLAIYNDLGIRQHREFSLDKPPGARRIGVFGDSFSENVAILAQHSYPEPLDYALNRLGRPVEVINFSSGGLGTDDAYLRYLRLGRQFQLDVVLYQFYENDLWDIAVHPAWEIGDHGELRNEPPAERPTLAAPPIYLWELITDVSLVARRRWGAAERADDAGGWPDRVSLARLAGYLAGKRFDQQRAREKLTGIIRNFGRAAAEDHAAFVVLLVPSKVPEADMEADVTGILRGLGTPTLDLAPRFAARLPEFRRRLYFHGDPHWTEAGNRLAAFFLAEFLAPRLGERWDETAAQQALAEYYAAFPIGGDDAGEFGQATLSERDREAILARYAQLDRQAAAGRIQCPPPSSE
jgi:hypothetical protein